MSSNNHFSHTATSFLKCFTKYSVSCEIFQKWGPFTCGRKQGVTLHCAAQLVWFTISLPDCNLLPRLLSSLAWFISNIISILVLAADCGLARWPARSNDRGGRVSLSLQCTGVYLPCRPRLITTCPLHYSFLLVQVITSAGYNIAHIVFSHSGE